jgi:hypothetical protein
MMKMFASIKLAIVFRHRAFLEMGLSQVTMQFILVKAVYTKFNFGLTLFVSLSIQINNRHISHYQFDKQRSLPQLKPAYR